MKLSISEMPSDLRHAFGEYEACVRDGASGETIGWGHRILRHLGETHWAEAAKYGDLVFGGELGKWLLITKWLTLPEAIEKYGAIVEVGRGPRGGFRSVVFGKTRFLNKRLVRESPLNNAY